MSGTRDIPLRPSRVDLIRTVAPEFVDPLSIVAEEPEARIHRALYDGRQRCRRMRRRRMNEPFAIDEATTVQARMFNKEGHGTATSRQTYKPVPAGTGLRYRIYQGSWTRMPDLQRA